jgi:hypothetical protein
MSTFVSARLLLCVNDWFCDSLIIFGLFGITFSYSWSLSEFGIGLTPWSNTWHLCLSPTPELFSWMKEQSGSGTNYFHEGESCYHSDLCGCHLGKHSHIVPDRWAVALSVFVNLVKPWQKRCTKSTQHYTTTCLPVMSDIVIYVHARLLGTRFKARNCISEPGPLILLNTVNPYTLWNWQRPCHTFLLDTMYPLCEIQ